jgi:two-component system response regulator YesN
MFKILIVDDEKIVLDAVKFILEKNFEGTALYEVARSGREAIEKADEFNPDIIMMDIRMPGINGIDAIKEIKSKKPKTHFIIVSAYEQFDFAKEAVELKVDDYILKPIIKSKLINVLENIMKKIDQEKIDKKKQLESLEKFERVLPVLEQGLVYAIMLGGCQENQLREYCDVLEITEEGGFVLMVERRMLLSEGENTPDISDEYYHIVSDALKFKCRCIVGPEMKNKVVALIKTSERSSRVLEADAVEIGEYIIKKVKSKFTDCNIKIGIGGYRVLEKLSESFEEAFSATKYENSINHVYHVSSLNQFGKDINITEGISEAETRLFDQIVEGNHEGALSSFDKIFRWIQANYQNSYEAGRARLGETMVVIYRTALQKGINGANHNNYLFELTNIEDYFKLEKWCTDRIMDIIQELNIIFNRKNSRIITGAKEFIYENFDRDITLDEAAKVVSVTPHYLSRLFKEETGENFIEYLTTYRIKKAKVMMDTTNLNIKEICYKIGYTDPNYFSRLFKKIEKVTPTDYMNNSKKS